MTRVSVLCSNLGTNCVMRATLLVELLCQDFEVRLVGFDQGSGLWAPAGGKRNTHDSALPFAGPGIEVISSRCFLHIATVDFLNQFIQISPFSSPFMVGSIREKVQ